MDELLEVQGNGLVITRQDVLERVNKLLVEHSIQNVMKFNDEIDSFGFVELIVTIEDVFGISIEPNELIMEKFCNIEYITDYLYYKYVNSNVIDAANYNVIPIDFPVESEEY